MTVELNQRRAALTGSFTPGYPVVFTARLWNPDGTPRPWNPTAPPVLHVGDGPMSTDSTGRTYVASVSAETPTVATWAVDAATVTSWPTDPSAWIVDQGFLVAGGSLSTVPVWAGSSAQCLTGDGAVVAVTLVIGGEASVTTAAVLAALGYTPADAATTATDAELAAGLAGKVGTADPRLSDARTPLAHTHVIADTTGLQAALDGKASTTDPRLSDARTPTAHTHPIGDVTGLQTVLDGKQAAGSYAPSTHTHTAASLGLATVATTGAYADLTGRPTLTGAGSPEGVVTASPGAEYVDTEGTRGAWRWLKISGTGAAGWVVTYGDTGWRDLTSTVNPAQMTVATGTVACRRINDLVTYRFSGLTPTTDVAVNAVNLLVAPAGFRLPSGTKALLSKTNGLAYDFAAATSATALFIVRAPTGTWKTTEPCGGYLSGVTYDGGWPTTLPGTPA